MNRQFLLREKIAQFHVFERIARIVKKTNTEGCLRDVRKLFVTAFHRDGRCRTDKKQQQDEKTIEHLYSPASIQNKYSQKKIFSVFISEFPFPANFENCRRRRRGESSTAENSRTKQFPVQIKKFVWRIKTVTSMRNNSS